MMSKPAPYQQAALTAVAGRIHRTAYLSMGHTDRIERTYASWPKFLSATVRGGFRRTFSGSDSPARAAMEGYPHNYEFLYDRLSVAEDRELLLRILARRCLDAERVPLIDLRREQALLTQLSSDVDKYASEDDVVEHLGWRLRRMSLARYGHDFDFYVNGIVLLYSFIRQQYEYPAVGFTAKAGDVVLDAGSCYGDNALTFAGKVGERGRVLTFEMVPDNIEVLQRNLEINPHLADRIELIDRPLYRRAGDTLYIHKKRAGARISTEPAPDGQARSVTTTTIDEEVAARGLSRLDVLKMDIEGAEMDALQGARTTIEKLRPKLAICVYHKPEDLDVIPRYIASIDPTYRFYLRHYSGSLLETVLYCM
jgi:FkbM family methyltransferase